MPRARPTKGNANDTSRTGGSEIPTKGLRYSKPGGGYMRVKIEHVAWTCLKCKKDNARYLAQCFRCSEPRPRRKAWED